MKFEIKSHVKNLKRRIQLQEEQKFTHNQNAKKAVLDYILKKKKTEAQDQEEVRNEDLVSETQVPVFSSYKDKQPQDRYRNLNSESDYADSLQELNAEDFTPVEADIQSKAFNHGFSDTESPHLNDDCDDSPTEDDVSRFQHSTKFDSMPIVDIDEEDFDNSDEEVEEDIQDEDLSK